jgi:hypothetical protein
MFVLNKRSLTNEFHCITLLYSEKKRKEKAQHSYKNMVFNVKI